MKKILFVSFSIFLFLFTTIAFAQPVPSGGGGSSTNTTPGPSGGGGGTAPSTNTPPAGGVGGIECSADQLRNGQCKLNIYQALGIKQNTNQDPTSVGLFLQDIVLSMTFFIGTLVTIVIIYAGVMFIRSGIKGDDALQSTAKKGIIGGLVGMLLVMGSYVIIRLVQYLVRGG